MQGPPDWALLFFLKIKLMREQIAAGEDRRMYEVPSVSHMRLCVIIL
jgi:hypothetical protein